MFLHNFKYALLSIIKSKTTLLWSFIFPIALLTLMYFAFGKLSANELLDTINVAVVGNNNLALETVLNSLSEEDEDGRILLNLTETDDEYALELLKNGEVSAIIYKDTESLVVKESGLNATVLEMILNEYKQYKNVITDIAMDNPSAILSTIDNMQNSVSYYVETKAGKEAGNLLSNYFYAIFAMSCLFASFTSVDKIQKLQANTSALGMRRCLAPTSKIGIIFAEYSAMLLVQFVIEMVSLVYANLIGATIGTNYPLIALTLLIGSSIGLSLGTLIATIPNLNFGFKIGLCVGSSMLFSFMADLCNSGIKYSIEKNVPFLNRINPAVLITNCFYSLNVYESLEKYFTNVIILISMSVVMLIASALILRRNKYASV